MNSLAVYWEEIRVGGLDRAGRRDIVFQYDADFLASKRARAISLSLPLRAEPFDPDRSRAWFANLLPEGEVRGHVARKLGLSERNDFALLDALGGDCAGALRLVAEADGLPGDGGLRPLSWNELEERIAETPRPSLLALMMAGRELRLSLAGAQDKLPIHLADGALALPTGGRPSTHLLKISRGDYPDLVANELFCLTLARRAGLDVPTAESAPTPTPILVIERYDRQADAGGRTHRLHQEDLCQALGVPPETKYENEGGPSLAAMFRALERGSRTPLPDKRELLRWTLLNYLIGNADAHAKNVSLLYGRLDDDRAPRLAPFYDLVCTEAYEHLSTKRAQRIGGEYRAGYVQARHWERLADEIGVRPRYLAGLANDLGDRVEEHCEAVARHVEERLGAAATLARIAAIVHQRTGQLRAQTRSL